VSVSSDMLLGELRELLRLTAFEQTVATVRRAQAASTPIAQELAGNAQKSGERIALLAQAVRQVGGVPDLIAPLVGRFGAFLQAQVNQVQTLQGALLGDLALEHQLRDRARYARTLAVTLGETGVLPVLDRLETAHSETIGWLEQRLDEVGRSGTSALKATPVQVAVGSALKLAGAPFALAAESVNRTAGLLSRLTGQAPKVASKVADATQAATSSAIDLTGSVASSAAEAASTAIDVASSAAGTATDLASSASGTATDLASSAAGTATELASSAADTASDLASSAADTATDAASTAADVASGVASSAADTVSSAASTAADVTSSAASTAADVTSSAASTAADVTSTAVDTAADVTSSAVDTAADVTSTAVDTAADTASSAAQSASDTVDRGAESVQQAAETAEQITHEVLAETGGDDLEQDKPPFAAYARLSGDSVIRHVNDTDDLDELRALLAFEQAHKARKGVLKAAQDRLTKLAAEA